MREQEWIKKTEEIFGVDQPEEVAAFCRKHWPQDVSHVLRTAQDACENTFLFDFCWDMERTWKPVHFEKAIDWSLIPEGDREFLWQFNRHRFLLCLSQAYQLTGEETYAENYVRLLTDWIDNVQEGDNIDLGPWRTLETGIRGEIWLRSLPAILKSDAAHEDFKDKVYSALIRHQRRLADHFLPHKYISNWGVLESCGLLLLSLVLPDFEEFVKLACRRLEDAAAVQVLEDGTQWEQSPMYHNEVYHCFLTALYYGERAGVRFSERIRETVRKMAYVNYKWKKPDHTQFTQGDSDASPLRSQITAGAMILKDKVLKSGGCEIMDYENAWMFGAGGIREYGAMETQQPDFVSAELDFSGNYYMRSGWGQKDNLLHFHCGETGGGHGHADKLHVDLVVHGEDLLVDSGRYTYVDGADRFCFKEAQGHNIVTVDGEGFALCDTSWVYRNLCTCLKQQYFQGRLGSFVEGTHLGYWEKGVLVNRKIIWIYPDIYVICDDLWGKGAHTYESFWHFSGHGKAALEENTVHFTGDEMEAFVQFTEKPDEARLEDTEQSSYYNEKHRNQTYRGISAGDGFCSQITLINGGERGKVQPVKFEKIKLYSQVNQRYPGEDEAQGLRLICGEKEYVLFLCHREILTPTDILSWENCLGHGKAVVFDRTKEKNEVLTGEILAW